MSMLCARARAPSVLLHILALVCSVYASPRDTTIKHSRDNGDDNPQWSPTSAQDQCCSMAVKDILGAAGDCNALNPRTECLQVGQANLQSNSDPLKFNGPLALSFLQPAYVVYSRSCTAAMLDIYGVFPSTGSLFVNYEIAESSSSAKPLSQLQLLCHNTGAQPPKNQCSTSPSSIPLPGGLGRYSFVVNSGSLIPGGPNPSWCLLASYCNSTPTYVRSSDDILMLISNAKATVHLSPSGHLLLSIPWTRHRLPL